MIAGIAWVELYLHEADHWREWFCTRLGFTAAGTIEDAQMRSYAVVNGGVLLLLSEARTPTSPVAQYLCAHPEGAADIAFTLDDPVVLPVGCSPGRLPGTWQLTAPTGIQHTFVAGEQTWLLPGRSGDLLSIDHVVLNVAAADFADTLAWYCRVLGFERDRYFEIATPHSALASWVLTDRHGRVRLPINAPLTANSQVEEFLAANRGAGVQHIALGTAAIASTVRSLRAGGVPLLTSPQTYYDQLGERVNTDGLDCNTLRELDILVDQDETDSRLLQIFTRPIFPEPTLFFELIERQGQARGFGEGNFQSLFEALEQEQRLRGSL